MGCKRERRNIKEEFTMQTFGQAQYVCFLSTTEYMSNVIFLTMSTTTITAAVMNPALVLLLLLLVLLLFNCHGHPLSYG